MRPYFFIFAISLWVIPALTTFVNAQNLEKEDVIYFKDGSILRGEILEVAEDSAIKLQTVGRNVVIVQWEEADSIKREEIPGEKKFKERGYFNKTGIDWLTNNRNMTIRLQTVNGYQFTPRFSLGIGAGITNYENDPLFLIPIFLETRFNFTEENTAPFIMLNSGYSIAILESGYDDIEKYGGGFVINPAFGFRYAGSPDFAFYINMGYNLEFAWYERRFGLRNIRNEITYQRIMFGFGFIF